MPSDVPSGRVNYISGENGSIIGDIISGKADIGLIDFVQSDDRSTFVTHSIPYVVTGAQILVKKPPVRKQDLLTLFKPFAVEVWALLGVGMIFVGILEYLAERFSPFAKRCREKVGRKKTFKADYLEIITCTNQINSFLSSRIMTIFCWIFAIFMATAYISNLSSYMISTGNEKPLLPFKTFHEISHQADIAYGGWFGMILDQNIELHRILDRFMTSKYTYYTDLDEAVSRILHSDGKFVAIVSGYEGEYLTNENCDLLLLQEQLMPLIYRFVCAKDILGEKICENISMSISTLRDHEILHKLIQKWWRKSYSCQRVSENDYISAASIAVIPFRSLSIREMTPTFVILLIGCLIRGIALGVERLLVCRKSAMALNNDSKATSETDTCRKTEAVNMEMN